MKKSFLNKLEELKPEVPVHLEVERKLIPRLKLMGYIMFSLCLCAFIFALTIKEDAEITLESEALHDEFEVGGVALIDDAELELAATEVLNFYYVSVVFASVGGSCFLIAWKKRKKLYSHPHS